MPVSFFWGEEDFLIEKEINAVKEKVLDGEISELNYRAIDNPPFNELVFLLRSQPMIFGECVYNIKADRYFLESGKKTNADEKQTDELVEALGMVSEKIHIIFVCQIPRGERKKPNSRKKLYKAVAKYGKIKEFQAFKAYEDYKILPVLKGMLKNYNLKAGNDALAELIARQGAYFRDLDSALQRLALFIYPKDFINKKAVENLYCTSQNIFVLIDLILEKKYDSALYEISNIFKSSHYLEILAFLQSGFSRILNTKVCSLSMAPFEIAKKTGQNEYAVKMTLNKTKNLELAQIIKLKQNLTCAEYEIKTGEKEPITALLEAFIKNDK